LFVSTDSSPVVQVWQGGSTLISQAITNPINSWTHIAVQRDSSNLVTIYINGVIVNQTTLTNDWASGTLQIGYDGGGGTTFNGYISNFRYVKGIAVYTTAFTPPTSSLTSTQLANVNGNPSNAIPGTQTQLLTLQNSTIVDNSSYGLTITNYGTLTTALQTTSFAGSTQGTLTYDGSTWKSTALVANGNVTANYFFGNGALLTGIVTTVSNISNGTSNVNIPTASSNITMSVAGNANIVTVTGTGVNIAGTLNTGSGNINTTGTINAAFFVGNGSGLTGITLPVSFANGNSNVSIPVANGNILVSVSGTANVATFTNNSMNVSANANITGNLVVQSGNVTIGSGTGGNIAGANAITSNSYTANGSVTGNANVTTVTGVMGIRSIASTYTDNSAAASATISNAAIHAFGIPTLAAANTTVTFTNAATFYIPAGPTAGTNATIGNSYSLMIGGNARFFGNIHGPFANGNSNVYIGTASSNVTIAAVGNTTLTITGTGINVAGTANFSGNLAAGNIPLITSGNSNITLTSNANVSTFITGNATAQLTVFATGANIPGTAIIGTAANVPLINSGNSNITLTSNANISTFITGNATAQLTVFATGANIPGTAIIGTAANVPIVQNGNSNVSIVANANVNFGITGTANVVSITAAGIITNAGNAAITSNSHTVSGAAFGNVNTAAALSNLGFRSVAATYTDTAATGTQANGAIHYIATPTITGGTNAKTYTNMATFAIAGNVTAGTNATITNNYALFVGGGNSFFGGNILGVLANGNSNVNIPAANGNVNISAVGVANILVVTGTGINVAGTLNTGTNAITTTGNVSAGNIIVTTAANVPIVQNGNSNVSIVANANINFGVTGTANVASITAAGIITTAANAAITSNSFTASGAAFGNVNTAAALSNLGFRTVAATYTDTAATGTQANAAIHYIAIPTITGGTNTKTYTNLATMYIAGNATAGTNATITNNYAMFIATGNTFFGGNVRVNSAGGLGYNSTIGSNTQLTSRNTGVTVSNVTGQITLFTTTMAANTTNTFTVTNTTVAATDVIILSQRTGANANYFLSVSNVAAGAFNISIYSPAGAPSEGPIINFAVIKTA